MGKKISQVGENALNVSRENQRNGTQNTPKKFKKFRFARSSRLTRNIILTGP